jgi:hypothetical protein
VDLLLVGGRTIVESAELRTADVDEVARDIARQSRRLLERAEASVGRPEAERRHQNAGLDAPRR